MNSKWKVSLLRKANYEESTYLEKYPQIAWSISYSIENRHFHTLYYDRDMNLLCKLSTYDRGDITVLTDKDEFDEHDWETIKEIEKQVLI
ncbi:hypothetical protein GCM10011571_33620 [Marinithermofilum abyssi]|uniref:Uncharacterized protein n=1 Tax=Marinithermofilum abyssi TaxID=1571185 RepID=A0A8J2YF83_9BACL|nr:hypothetical protein [Marinithermofilum abyssi]GGE28775.1 hypothetical protein GCM10011571_33620 [Marinithermofilum abyssi]